MKVGDYVTRSWKEQQTELEDFGIILELQERPPFFSSPTDIDESPVHRIVILRDDGKIDEWYAAHAEVVSECR